MLKPDYGAFYKFRASLGIDLTIVAVGLTWIYFREPFYLLVSQEELENLTVSAKNTIKLRQSVLDAVTWAVVVVSSLCLICWISVLCHLCHATSFAT